MGQSRISTHLSQIRRHGLLNDRKDGKKTFYSLQLSDSSRLDLIRVALREDLDEEFWESDQAGLNRIIDRRRSESERYFDEVAERLGKIMFPDAHGMIGHFLLCLVPSIEVADLGAGEGTISASC